MPAVPESRGRRQRVRAQPGQPHLTLKNRKGKGGGALKIVPEK